MRFPPLDALIPHQPPMRLINEIVDQTDREIVCRGMIPLELAVDGAASPLLGIEMGAQAAAAGAALRRAGQARDTPEIGYLVSIRDAHFNTRSLPAGRGLRVSARPLGTMHELATYQIAVSEYGAAGCYLTARIGTYAAAGR